MKMRQPLALLLGGLMSASSVGCAALDAVVSDTTSRPTDRKASAQRMVAIARVFENQGRYDQAEAMYRKALRLTPKDQTLKGQLTLLAEKRQGQEFVADPTIQAIAAADAVSGSAKSRGPETAAELPITNRTSETPKTADIVARKTQPGRDSSSGGSTVAMTAETTRQTTPARAASISSAETADYLSLVGSETARGSEPVMASGPVAAETSAAATPLQDLPAVDEPGIVMLHSHGRTSPAEQRATASVGHRRLLPAVEEQLSAAGPQPIQERNAPAGRSDAEMPHIVPLPAPATEAFHWIDSAPLPPVETLASDTEPAAPTPAAVQSAAADPNAHIPVLIRALKSGSTPEVRQLAATLLGECDPRNMAVRKCLSEAMSGAVEDGLVLAVADSQIQRHQPDAVTARRLAKMASDPTSPYQVQAATSLTHFAGTATHTACTDALAGLLVSDNPAVRTAAATTLGDFAERDKVVLTMLTELAAEDPDLSVREAARSALARQTISEERAEVVIIRGTH